MENNNFNLFDYYKALEGLFESNTPFIEGEWQLNFGKSHSFSVDSDLDRLDEQNEKIVIEPIEEQLLDINVFSNQLDIDLFRTEIVSDSFGGEDVELKLDERIITLIIDQSGSMTWNDNEGVRHDISRELVENVDSRYPGEINYNIIEFGGKPVKISFYGVAEDIGGSIPSVSSLNDAVFGDDEYNFAGVRVVRKLGSYPNHPLDGDIITEGLMTSSFDTDLIEDTEYFYTVYTFSEDSVFSNGTNIKTVPREQIVPRGISLISDQILIGSGSLRDENTIGLWHIDEGEENYLYDFSDSKIDLDFTKTPLWYEEDQSASGESAVRFNGIDTNASIDDSDKKLEILNGSITIMAWIYPFDLTTTSGIISRFASGTSTANYALTKETDTIGFYNGFSSVNSSLKLNEGEWNFVAITYDSSSGDVVFYVNKQVESSTIAGSFGNISNPVFSIGYYDTGDKYFFGRISEASIHNTIRDSDYINSQIFSITDPITGENTGEIRGSKGDNGDRLVLFKYSIPEDFNFSGGNVKIIRREFESPTWDGDEKSQIIELKTNINSGFYYTTDVDNFSLGDKYYYRIFTQNTLGNYSYIDDSIIIEIEIPKASNFELISDVEFPFFAPIAFDAQTGNKKIYLTWQNINDSRNSRIKIYRANDAYPVVSEDGNSNGELVFVGLPTDTSFVSREIDNDIRSFYSIVYTDKYGRPTQTINGVNIGNTSEIPLLNADEAGIPLAEVSDLHYNLIDNESISLSWEKPVEFKDNLDGYLDQSVYFYAAITDTFGQPISEETIVTLDITPVIIRSNQADNVFKNQATSIDDIEDSELYSFTITQDEDTGVVRGVLDITKDPNLLRLIESASFSVRVKSVIPSDDGENVFEYFSKPITATLTNPWEIELFNLNSDTVKQRCYFIKVDKKGELLSSVFSNISKQPDRLVSRDVFYDGAYVGASNPFVARAILSYKGDAVFRSTNIDISIWDAENELCTGADDPESEYIGEKIRVSSTVTPPSNSLPIQNKIQETVNEDGLVIERKEISFVDIPIFAPATPQASKLFVRGGFGGFTSIKDLYVVFKGVLNIDIVANAPLGDGRNIEEQVSTSYLIDPDHPDDENFNTLLPNDTLVKWNMIKLEGAKDRPFYSIDDVPISLATNGIYSLVRNGTARSVYFGPAEEITDPFEQYEINATVTYNNLEETARQFVEINSEDPNEPFAFGNKFLMEFSETLSGKIGSVKQNHFWTDGIDYLKLIISRDPNSSTTKVSKCFRNCASQFSEDLLELDSGQKINLSAGGDIDFIWGSVDEFFNPYTEEWELELNGIEGIDYFISNRTAEVSLVDDFISDTTEVFIRSNVISPIRTVLQTGLAFEARMPDEFFNPCECLSIKNEFKIPEDIVVSGSTVKFINNSSIAILGGGDEDEGVPPTILAPHEPLQLFLIDQMVDGETFGIFGDLTGKYAVQYSSTINFKARIMFAGKNVPEGTPVSIVIGNADGRARLKADRNTVFAEIDSETGYSIINATILPSQFPEKSFNEEVKIICTYDKLGEIERNSTYDIKIEILGQEEEDVEQKPFDQEDEPEGDSVFTGSMEVYNTETDEWFQVSSMQEPRGNLFFEFSNNSLFAIGGVNKNIVSNTNEKYNLLMDVWENKKVMPTPRFAGMSVSIDDKIYVIGGIKDDAQIGRVVSNDVEVYDAISDTWSILSNMPLVGDGLDEKSYGVCFGSAKYINVGGENRIYVISGSTALGSNEEIEDLNDRILYYNIDSNTWFFSDAFEDEELVLYSRMSFNSFVKDNEIIVFGGVVDNSSNTFDLAQESYAYNVLTGILRNNEGDFSKFPTLRGFSASVTDDFNPSKTTDHYILGGSNENSNNLKIVEKISSNDTPYEHEQVSNMLFAKTSVGASMGTIDDDNPSMDREYNDGIFYNNIPHIFIVGGYVSGRDNGFLKIELDLVL